MGSSSNTMLNLTSYGKGKIEMFGNDFTGNKTFACLAVGYLAQNDSTGILGFLPSRCTQAPSDEYKKDYFCYKKGVRGTVFI
jgi:hypothetical protein